MMVACALPDAWSYARRRSATSRTSRCACSRRCTTPTSSRARTRARRRCCSTATASRASACATTRTSSGGWRRGSGGGRQPVAAPRLVEQMQAGRVVALVSDAGMPLVSDPGFVLVQACVAAGLAVEVLPGPSAALAAVVASGLPAETWRFVGFLPRKRGELEAAFRVAETLVAFESPRRVGASLAVLASVDPERPVAVCRELTKVHEEVVRGTASELAARYAEAEVRGEVVLVVGPAPAEAAALETGVSALRRLVEAGARARPAAGVVAELTGLTANALYRALTVPEV